MNDAGEIEVAIRVKVVDEQLLEAATLEAGGRLTQDGDVDTVLEDRGPEWRILRALGDYLAGFPGARYGLELDGMGTQEIPPDDTPHTPTV